MQLIDIDIEYRVIFGISAMVLLFASFLIAFISSQRKKLQYHRELQAISEQQQKNLTEQNIVLEKRVQERTSELLHQKDELQKSLQELKSTQLQLVQKEKMASLGELTAGIAHEIQNPLNFVNNFSDISIELLDEMEKELTMGEKEDAIAIADDIKQNLEKINHHGKRADGIVKAMLEHSKVHTGKREPTDINLLAEKSLQLSYHAFQVKDKSFQASLQTDFDKHVSKIDIIPQDIGRVFFNLFNNAFYAASLLLKKGVESSYIPTITVTTSFIASIPDRGGEVCIRVRDNGPGISKKIIGKIFQPFFTTKPTGEGTGLGLSLSYDIIKAHGGELKVETVEGEYAEFIILLPVTTNA